MDKKENNKKLNELITIVSNVAMGDLSQKVKVKGNDEFAALGMSINAMIDNLNYYRSDAINNILGVVSDIAMGDLSKEIKIRGDGEIAALGMAINEMNNNLKNYHNELTNKILAVVSDVSMGDLSKEIEIGTHDNLAALKLAINEVINILRKTNNKLRTLAETDPLTGIYNRRRLFEILDLDLKRIRRYKNHLSIAMLDLDHFKQINDNYGHIVGDQILRNTVQIITPNIRKADVLGRYGGEEFLLIMINTSKKQAFLVSEKIRKLFEQTKHSKGAHVTISIGVAEFQEEDTLESLLKRADQALYKAKEKRNKVICF